MRLIGCDGSLSDSLFVPAARFSAPPRHPLARAAQRIDASQAELARNMSEANSVLKDMSSFMGWRGWVSRSKRRLQLETMSHLSSPSCTLSSFVSMPDEDEGGGRGSARGGARAGASGAGSSSSAKDDAVDDHVSVLMDEMLQQAR